MTRFSVSITPSKQRKPQGRGRSNSLPSHVAEYLKNWLMKHIEHPYPSESEKARMVSDTGIEIKRLNNWFVNNRIRFWKPRFEAMQKQQEQKKRKLSESTTEESSSELLSETSSMTPSRGASKETPRGTPRETSPSPAGVGPEATKNFQVVVVPAAPRIDHISNLLVHTVINDDVPATVVSDDSCSNSLSSNCEDQVSANHHFDLKNTTRFLRCCKRQRTEIGNDRLDITVTPRFKYICNDVEQWKLACLTSPNKLDDTDLPSLDEAAHLFGYSLVT